MTNDLLHRKAAAAKAFNAIGRKNGSAPPEGKDNRLGVAYEFYIANHLRSMANARYDAAKDAALDAGVIDINYPVGTHIPYHADGLSIIAKRNNDSSTLDKTLLANNLQKDHGFDESKTRELIQKSSNPRKGALSYDFSVEE
jgi:hypothetical protein